MLLGKAQSGHSLAVNTVKGDRPCAFLLLRFLFRPYSVPKRTVSVNVFITVNTEIAVIPNCVNPLFLFFLFFLLLFQNILYLLIRYQGHGIIPQLHPDADHVILIHRRKKPGADSLLICFHLACVHVQYIQGRFPLFTYAVFGNHLPPVHCPRTVCPLLRLSRLLSISHSRCSRRVPLPLRRLCFLDVLSFRGTILPVLLSCAALSPDIRAALLLFPGPAGRSHEHKTCRKSRDCYPVNSYSAEFFSVS